MALDEIRRLVRQALGIMPTLDLHGLGVKDALVETERFLADAQAHGLGSVKIDSTRRGRSRACRPRAAYRPRPCKV